MADAHQDMKLIIVTGLSGSGCSVALKSLEDLGYYCVDCLPIELITPFIEHAQAHPEQGYDRIALGVDIRSKPHHDQQLDQILTAVRDRVDQCQIVFLSASDACLHKRYSETRRRHPLAAQCSTLAASITQERQMLRPIETLADHVIDTTTTSVHELRRLLGEALGQAPDQITLMIESFGYKKGVPRDIDVAFDVRCLPNPYWEPELRALSGRDPAIAQWFESKPLVAEMLDDIHRWMCRWLPEFIAQQRHYMTLGIGCTGGKHRSVYLVERLTERMQAAGYQVVTYHRELA